MELIESAVFTRQVQALLADGEYLELQWYLMLRPDSGVLIPGSGGLRKLRWRLTGRGRRGGARVIYYWKSSAGQLFLLYMYAKNQQSDLPAAALQTLWRSIADD